MYYYRSPDHGNHYVLSFAFAFEKGKGEDDDEGKNEKYFFAMAFPYSYSRMRTFLERLKEKHCKDDGEEARVKVETIVSSVVRQT